MPVWQLPPPVAWLHVDFDHDLREFYIEACGFTPTTAGLIALLDRAVRPVTPRASA